MVKPMLLQEDIVDNALLLENKKEELTRYINDKYNGWIFQIKQNGVRAVISIKNKKITSIRNREDVPMLQNFPELKDLEFPIEEGLLDAEIVMLDKNKKSHFYNEYDSNEILIQPGIQLRSASIKGNDIISKYPVNIIFFDVLKLNGKIMISETYENRMKELRNLLDKSESDRWSIVKDCDNFELIWERVWDEDLEGVVIKNPKGLYEIDTRSKNNIKLKHYKIIDVEVLDTSQNPKGCKVTAKALESGIDVNFQVFGANSINKGTIMKMKYLEKIGGAKGRYSQTTVS